MSCVDTYAPRPQGVFAPGEMVWVMQGGNGDYFYFTFDSLRHTALNNTGFYRTLNQVDAYVN